MDIRVNNSSNSNIVLNGNDTILVTAISNYIKKSNFPKNLVLRKFDLIIEKYKDKLEKISDLYNKTSKTNERIKSEIVSKDSNNKNTITELMNKLS